MNSFAFCPALKTGDVVGSAKTRKPPAFLEPPSGDTSNRPSTAASGRSSQPAQDRSRAGRESKVARSSSAGASPNSAGSRSRPTSNCRLRVSLSAPGTKPPSGVLSGLAPATRQENQKADRFEEQYQRARSCFEAASQTAVPPQKQASPTGQGAEHARGMLLQAGDAPGAPAIGFEEDLKQFEGLLEDLGKSIRMERLLEAAKEADAKEEEIRRQRERERKIRDATRERQAAANPQRRIALRLERCREAGMAEQVEISGNTIPLKKHLVMSGHSPERLEIVNVPILQKRCVGLPGDGSSTSYKSLVKYVEIEEKRQQWVTAAFANNVPPHDYVRENLQIESVRSRTWDCISSKMSEQERRARSRHYQAAVRRGEVFGERHRRKAQRDLDRVDKMPADGQRANSPQAASPLGTHRSSVKKEDSPVILRSKSFKKLLAKGESFEMLYRQQRKGLFFWRVVRGVLGAVWLLRLVRKRQWAMDVVRKFVCTVERLETIRLASRRICVGVMKTQIACRAFLARKRRWCDSVTRLWVQFEDQYLQSCFKLHQRPEDGGFSDKVQVAEFFEKVGRSTSRRRRSNNHVSSQGADWRIFRVPPPQRRFTLGRWYILQVKQWIANRDHWVSIVRRAMQSHRDVRDYMQLCGIDPAATDHRHESKGLREICRTLPQMSVESSMGLSEFEALELVRLAASELAGIAPFPDHPANRGHSVKAPARVSGALRRILQKRPGMTLQERRQQVEVGRATNFSIDTMEQADYSEAVGERRSSSTRSEKDDALFDAYAAQLQSIA